MAWVDDGRGRWISNASDFEPEAKPVGPPPSAGQGQGGLAGGRAVSGTPAAAAPPAIGSDQVTTPQAWDSRASALQDTMARNPPGTPRHQEAQDALNRLGPRPNAAPSAGAPTIVGASGGSVAGPTPEAPVQVPGNPNHTSKGGSHRVTSAHAPTAPAPAPAAPTQPTLPPAAVDYSRYDQAAAGYNRAVATFQAELDRLSGVDPFGNQAFLQKATDRAVGQAAGLAAGGLSTATARAGNMRQAQGVQASLAAQGIQQQAVQRSQDEVQAGALRAQNATGLANTVGQKAQNEVALAQLQTQTIAQNLDRYKFDRALTQQDVESLRSLAVAYSQLDENARQADEANLVQRYGIDQGMYSQLKQIAAQENISFGEFAMGLMGAGAGLAGGIATAPKGSMVNPEGSDRRFKFDVQDPDLRDLQDFLGKTRGKLYRYKEPDKPGRRQGLQFGPMAQDLAKTKIGKTVVVQGKDGLYVDTARLALVDHAALADLARQVAEMKNAKAEK